MRSVVLNFLLLIVISSMGATNDFAQGVPPKPHIGAEAQVIGPNAAAQHAAEHQIISAQVNHLVVATGAVSGTVLNASGGVVANALVTVLNKATNQTWTARSDSQGRYSVAGLPPGAYSVTVEIAGFQRKIVDGVTVTPGQATGVNTSLNVWTAKIQGPGTILAPKPPPILMPIPKPMPPPVPMPTPVLTPPPPPPPVEIKPVQPGKVESVTKQLDPIPSDPKTPDPKPLDPVAAENKAFLDWHKSLPEGLSEHHVDPLMRLGSDSAVTFTIHGPNAAPTKPADGAVPEKLQVSPHMAVYLTQPNNPDGFKIVEVDTPQNPKRVAPDGTTVWTWIVTPQKLGPLKLHFAAYVLRDETGTDKVSYESYDASIDVKSVTLWGYLTSGLLWVLQNPLDSLKWILPGGAGAAMIGKLIHWLLSKRKKKTDPEEGTPA